jgi:hypothetical protein
MNISDRLKEIYNVFPDLNQEAKRIEKQILKVYQLYRNNDLNHNFYIMTRLCEKLIPKAWSWSVEYSGSSFPDVVPILGRFFPLIVDEKGEI